MRAYNQRERLIELIAHAKRDDPETGSWTDWLVDYLLANGVIVPPVKVGQTVYDIYEAKANGEGIVRALGVTDIRIHLDKRNKAWLIIGGYYFAMDDFGKTVFLSREEAEAALKGDKV